MKWESAPALLLDASSHEPMFAGYEPWFMPGKMVAVTRSEYEALNSIVTQFVAGEITKETAMAAELAFLQEGWSWADKVGDKEKQRTYAESLLDALLVKKRHKSE